MGHGAAQRSLGIGLRDDDDGDDDDEGLCQKWRVKLIFRGTYTGCPEPTGCGKIK